MPGTFALTAVDRPNRGTSPAPQELSLVLYRPGDQSPSRPSPPASPTGPDDPARETARQFSPTATLESDQVDRYGDRGSLTPKPSGLGSPSRADSQSPVPLGKRNYKGKHRAVYSDKDSISGTDEGEDVDMPDDQSPRPRYPSGEVFRVSPTSVIETLTLSRHHLQLWMISSGYASPSTPLPATLSKKLWRKSGGEMQRATTQRTTLLMMRSMFLEDG